MQNSWQRRHIATRLKLLTKYEAPRGAAQKSYFGHRYTKQDIPPPRLRSTT